MELKSTDYASLWDMPQMEGVSLNLLHKQQSVFIIKYLVLMYDKGSPLQFRYSDLEKRKDVAVELAGLRKNDQRDLIEELKEFGSDRIIRVVSDMLKKQADHSLSLLHSQEQLFYELLYYVVEPISKDESDKDKMVALEKKAKLSEQMEEVSDRIEKYRAKYFRGDAKLEKKVKGIRYSPESIARA